MIYSNLWGSVTKMSLNLISQITTSGVASPQFLDWDAHANIHELPNVDLVGPTAFGFIEDDKVISVNFSLGFSTYNDLNLFRLRAIGNVLFEALRPGSRFIYYNATAAVAVSYLVVTNGTTLLPVTRSETRPFQFVQVEALLEPSAAL